MPSTTPSAFRAENLPSLHADEARHNLLLKIFETAEADPSRGRLWSFGPGARCAGQTPPHFIALADLTRADCRNLAREVKGLHLLGCIGPDPVAAHFAEALKEEGIETVLHMPQRIHVLKEKPVYPGSPGQGRRARAEDLELYIEWTIAFCVECRLAEGAPSADALRAAGIDREIYFWEQDGRPVAMASLSRVTPHGGNISLVYTPPAERGRGFGGSVTAFVADAIYARGKEMVFLYTDLRNPVSNRVYEEIGFRLHCDVSSFLRLK